VDAAPTDGAAPTGAAAPVAPAAWEALEAGRSGPAVAAPGAESRVLLVVVVSQLHGRVEARAAFSLWLQ